MLNYVVDNAREYPEQMIKIMADPRRNSSVLSSLYREYTRDFLIDERINLSRVYFSIRF